MVRSNGSARSSTLSRRSFSLSLYFCLPLLLSAVRSAMEQSERARERGSSPAMKFIVCRPQRASHGTAFSWSSLWFQTFSFLDLHPLPAATVLVLIHNSTWLLCASERNSSPELFSWFAGYSPMLPFRAQLGRSLRMPFSLRVSLSECLSQSVPFGVSLSECLSEGLSECLSEGLSECLSEGLSDSLNFIVLEYKLSHSRRTILELRPVVHSDPFLKKPQCENVSLRTLVFLIANFVPPVFWGTLIRFGSSLGLGSFKTLSKRTIICVLMI